MTTTEPMQPGRAKNATLAYLERRISVPKIYLDALWGGEHVDVLAIDRDGAGDVHAVLLFARPHFEDGRLNLEEQQRAVDALVARFKVIPANFKYVAAVDTKHNGAVSVFQIAITEALFSSDGIGRIGILYINAAVEEPQVELRVRPERFRAKIAKLADDYIEQHLADWEIRA